MQCTVKKGSKAWKDAQKITIESSLLLSGIAKEDQRAPGGYEITTGKLEIVGLSEAFPIAKDQSEKFLRDVSAMVWEAF
jgi:asparaginyl-tRNA synthetase